MDQWTGNLRFDHLFEFALTRSILVSHIDVDFSQLINLDYPVLSFAIQAYNRCAESNFDGDALPNRNSDRDRKTGERTNNRSFRSGPDANARASAVTIAPAIASATACPEGV
jgi:hypothetical protein